MKKPLDIQVVQKDTMEVFRLSQWRRELDENPQSDSLSLPGGLTPDQLDFVAFDPFGSLYLGVTELDLVLRVHVNRPGVPGAGVAFVAGSVTDSPFAEHR